MKTQIKPDKSISNIVLLMTATMLAYFAWAGLNKSISLPEKKMAIIDSSAEETSLSYLQFENPDISNYNEIINRPLFFEDRKPYVYVEPVKTKTAKKQTRTKTTPKKNQQYELNAVIITPEKQFAIIQTGREKTLQRFAPGELVNGWTLENIDPRFVMLKKGNEEKRLELEVKTSKLQTKKANNNKNEAKNEQVKIETDKNQKPEKQPDT